MRDSPPVSSWLDMCSIFETMFTSFASCRSLKSLPFIHFPYLFRHQKRQFLPLVAITVTLSQFRFLALLPEIWQAADPLGTHSGNASWGKTIHDYCGVQVLVLISTSCWNEMPQEIWRHVASSLYQTSLEQIFDAHESLVVGIVVWCLTDTEHRLD